MYCSQSVQAMLVHLEMGPGPYVSDEWPLTFSVAIVMFSLDGLHWGISFKGGGGMGGGLWVGVHAGCGSLGSGDAGGDQSAWWGRGGLSPLSLCMSSGHPLTVGGSTLLHLGESKPNC